MKQQKTEIATVSKKLIPQLKRNQNLLTKKSLVPDFAGEF